MAFEPKPMVKKLSPLKEILDKKSEEADPMDSESTERETEPGYDTYQEELKEILGLDDAQAARLKEAICGMMEEKSMMGDSEEEDDSEEKPAPGPGGKKKGLAIILGS